MSSSRSMFPPPYREKAGANDSGLPQGGCCFIMLHAEAQLRCPCVGFALSRAIPAGSTCDCGHQACYHTAQSVSVERAELEALTKKVEMLERRSERSGLVDRVGCLEELVDRTRGDTESQFKDVYRAQGAFFQHIKQTQYYQDNIEALEDRVQGIRDHLEEMDDASMRLEDRVDALEKSTGQDEWMISRQRKASTPPSSWRMMDQNTTESSVKSETADVSLSLSHSLGLGLGHSLTPRQSRLPLHLVPPEEASRIRSFRERVSSVGSGSQSWAVHISLLPTSAQPFPFEKDTAAYKRCLSRGLHQVVVIPDTDSISFQTAVNDAFAAILHGRPWHPLVAQLCDAMNLKGLPMLRQLDESLMGSSYDAEFLQRNESGKILDLYIAMAEDTISWAELRDVAPFKPGLEASWIFEPLLDGPSLEAEAHDPDTTRPAAGDIVTAWSPNLKRSACEISRASSLGSGESEGDRPKISQCTDPGMKMLERRAEKV